MLSVCISHATVGPHLLSAVDFCRFAGGPSPSPHTRPRCASRSPRRHPCTCARTEPCSAHACPRASPHGLCRAYTRAICSLCIPLREPPLSCSFSSIASLCVFLCACVRPSSSCCKELRGTQCDVQCPAMRCCLGILLLLGLCKSGCLPPLALPSQRKSRLCLRQPDATN